MVLAPRQPGRMQGRGAVCSSIPRAHFLHGAGKYGLQCLANLDQLPPAGTVLVAPSPKINNGTGSALRFVSAVATPGCSGMLVPRGLAHLTMRSGFRNLRDICGSQPLDFEIYASGHRRWSDVAKAQAVANTLEPARRSTSWRSGLRCVPLAAVRQHRSCGAALVCTAVDAPFGATHWRAINSHRFSTGGGFIQNSIINQTNSCLDLLNWNR